MKTILVDMDMTLNKLWISFCKILAKEFGSDALLYRNQLKEYKICFNIPSIPQKDWFEITNEIFCTKGFWESIPIWEDAREVLNILDKKFDVYIVSKPWINYDLCAHEKLEWIKSNLPFFNLEKVIFTGHKHMIKGHYIIDDAPIYMNLKGLKTIAMNYPYNESFNVERRVDDWISIGKYFKVIEE